MPPVSRAHDHDSRPLRVAFTLGGTDRGRSGIGVYVRETLPRLAARLTASGGSLVVVGTRLELDSYADAVAGLERVVVPGLFDAPAPSAIWAFLRADRVARAAGADVTLFPAATRRFSARPRLPAVGIVHDLGQLHVARKYDALRMFYFKRLLLGTLRRASTLVAISVATRDDLVAAIGVDPTQVRVVPNGVDVTRFTPAHVGDRAVSAALASLGVSPPYLLYAARLEHPGKNHLRLLQAFAASRLRDTHVLAFSGADWGAGGLIAAEVESLQLGHRVRILGYVADDALPALVAAADAIIMVGLREGFGLPALEGLAAGRPVVASSTGSLPEVVGPLGAQCDPFDVLSIRAALERATDDRDLRRRAAEEGPAWAAARGWDATVAGLLAACRAAAHGSR